MSSPMHRSCSVGNCILICGQRKKIRRIMSPSEHSDEQDVPTLRPGSPLRLTVQQKGKVAETQNVLPTPSRTQRHFSHDQSPQQSSSQHRERPGPNSLAQNAGRQLRNTSPVPDQHEARERRDGQSRTSRRERQTTEKKWTHLAKIYAMFCSPWISHSELDYALRCKTGQCPPEDNADTPELVQLLDNFEVSNHECGDPRFQTNVSFILPKCIF